jgi:RHS repeat-associated protein
MDDPSTTGVTEGFGLMDYNARMYDPYLGRFTSADSIVPQAVQGVQAWDRYAYVNNNPVNHNDPTGHYCVPCFAVVLAAGVFLGESIYNNFIREPSRPADANASSLRDLINLGYEHAEHANIVGEGLQSLQDDPDVQDVQRRIVTHITDKPKYGEQPYSLKNIQDPDGFHANGPSRNWFIAGATGNQGFYMVHTGNISATNIKVSADGTISTTWVINDDFDYIPDFEGHGFAYNAVAILNYPFYYTMLGSKKQYPVTAKWNEIIHPSSLCERCR